ncbi:hypothetical protein B9G98_00366 [Wickerhamiella sorbophila]|uniref:Uncharacterized protein n=1 Tax=Wickerhamiella sorbophila TaxID=45607 RepID=A0A2T0FCM5_9ASCO|nr:hypothetical protein B9G98_00366 [Wickerhamiella sorbophila]PRT52746.1 hypothetical protein B9G98_00366 [Wickerhamiella sorbophila]
MEAPGSRNGSDQGLQKSLSDDYEGLTVSSAASSSRFGSPALESQTKWADEVSALMAMEEFVVQGISDILKDGSVESLEQVPRKLIKYSELLAQQGRGKPLWSRIKHEIGSSLIATSQTIVNLGQNDHFIIDAVAILNRTRLVLSVLSKIYSLVSGSSAKDARFLNMGVITDVVLGHEEIIDRLCAVYVEAIDLIIEDTELQIPIDSMVNLSGFFSGESLKTFLQLIQNRVITSAKELLEKQQSLFSGERKDRLLLRHCQLLTSWIHTLEHAWNKVGLGKVTANQEVLEVIVSSAITEANLILFGCLPAVLIRNNAKALTAYQRLISTMKGSVATSDQFVRRALGQACTQIVNSGLKPIERAAIFQRLHALLVRCPAPDSRSYQPFEMWTKALEETDVDTAKIGRDLARYVLFEIGSPRGMNSISKRNKRVLNAGDLVSSLNEDSKKKFVSELLNSLKALLLPRPDGKTVDIDQEHQKLIVATLDKIDRKYGYFAKIILSDCQVSASLDECALIGNRSAWHLDYQLSTVTGTKVQNQYEELYTDRKAVISEALSSTQIFFGGDSFFVSNVQLAILKHLESSTNTYKTLVQQLPFERSEIRNALVDLLSGRAELILWHSHLPGKTFKRDDVFALNPNPMPKSKFLYRLRVADHDLPEED